MLRAESNEQDGTNGGKPLAIDILANGSFPRFSSKTNADDFFLWCKCFCWADSNTDPVQQAAYDLFDLQVALTFGNHFYNIVPQDGPAGLRSTWADVEPNLATLRRYGVGRLTAPAAVGDTSITVDVKNSILATGDESIFRANGSTITDNLIIDKRSAPGTLDWAQMEEIVGSNAVPNGSTVTITLAAPLVNSYPIDARVYSQPDKVDLVPSITNVVMTNAGSTTFAQASVVLYPASTWVDEIEIELLAANGNYKVTSAKYGVAGGSSPITYNKATAASPSWPAIGVSGPQFKIPAGCIGGTNAAGNKITFKVNGSMMAFFVLLHHPTNAGLKSHTQVLTVKYEV
jgi:hypothetical protein